jgi:hypothetical protein
VLLVGGGGCHGESIRGKLDAALRCQLEEDLKILLDAHAMTQLEESASQCVVRDRDAARCQDAPSSVVRILISGV